MITSASAFSSSRSADSRGCSRKEAARRAARATGATAAVAVAAGALSESGRGAGPLSRGGGLWAFLTDDFEVHDAQAADLELIDHQALDRRPPYGEPPD